MGDSWSENKICRDNGKNRRSSDGRVDRISDLPDCLLEQILSNMEIKEAIKTSLISRRWRHLWTRVPSLKFVFTESDYYPDLFNYIPSDPLPHETLCYNLYLLILMKRSFLFIPRFVDNVFNRLGACEIDKFEFRCNVRLDPRFLNSMMSRVMSLKPKEVELKVICTKCPFSGDRIWQLPECFFANKSLKKLELCTRLFNPPKINSSFLTLKELRIDCLDCEFPGPNSHWRQSKVAPWQLLCTSQCPVLETLSFTMCYCPTIDLEISSPMLKRLQILRSRFKRVTVSSPLLAYFKFKGFGVEEIAIDDRGNFLEEVEIHFEVDGNDLKEKSNLFVRRLQKEKSLVISW